MLARNPKIVLQLLLVSALLLVAAVACEPDVAGLFVLMADPGTTEDGLDYDENDVLFYDPDATNPGWGTLFDGEWYGLNDDKHALGAFSFNEYILYHSPDAATVDAPGELELYFSLQANRAWVPDIPIRVQGQDVIRFYTPNGWDYEYELMLDGSDIDLTKETEKIDGLSVWPMEYFNILAPDVDLPYDCYGGVYFISTRGNYRVSSDQMGGSQLIGSGSDVLAFCATNTGEDTAGYWFRVFQSKEADMFPRSVMTSIDVFYLEPEVVNRANDYGNFPVNIAFFFTARNPFTSHGEFFNGNVSELFLGAVEHPDHYVLGPVWNLNDPGVPALNGTVTGLGVFEHMEPYVP